MTLAAGKPIEENVLVFLSSEYVSNPITHGGRSQTQYRFSYNDQKIFIHDNGSNSGWYLSADSPFGVRKLLEKFDDISEGHFPEINDG